VPESVPANPAPAAFISYSRDDSEFALRLAQDLKAAGAAVWLDQLDIDAGQLWDNAVEDALIASPRMLLILSPGSARSNNVRNEISFALEQGKVVLPILYRDCTVPLQLQRANRIDFRADYAQGLAALLTALHVPHTAPLVAAASVLTPPPQFVDPPPAHPEPVSPPPQIPPQIPSSAPSQASPRPAAERPQPAPVIPEKPVRGSGRLALIAAAVLVPIVAVVIYLAMNHRASAPTPAPIQLDQPNAARLPNPRRKPGAGEAAGYPACVFAPVSHIRVEPAAKSDIACSIDTIQTIHVGETPIHRGPATWWPTDYCGTPGYIADNQIHVQTECPKTSY
jgi:hypothetical protein